MIEKGVKAPLTYNPGKGRPKEHLAYLNKGEMKVLRLLNGNNIERGPSGLPSFPPADSRSGNYNSGYGSAASSSKPSSGGPRSGVSGSVSPTSGSPRGSNPSSNFGGGGSNSVSKPSGGMMGGTGSGGSSRTAPSRAPSVAGRGTDPNGIGRSDKAAINAVNKANTKTALKSPAIIADRSRTLNVGPMGTPVRVPSVRGPQIWSMPNIQPPTGPMPQGIKNLIESASYLLDPNDPTLARRAIASTEPAPTFGEALSNLSMRDFTKGIYDLGIGGIKGAIDVAYDPYGSLKRGIGAIDNYVRDQFGNIISGSEAAMLGPGYGDPGAIGRGFISSTNIPMAGNLLGTVPQNSLAALVGTRSADPDVARAYMEGQALLAKGVHPEEVFYKTSKIAPEYASGLQRVVPGFNKYAIEVYDPYTLQTPSTLERVRSGLFGKSLSEPVPLSQVIKAGPTQKSYPEFGNVMLSGDLSKYNPKTMDGTLGWYAPPAIETVPNIPSLRKNLLQKNPEYGWEQIAVNVPIQRSPYHAMYGLYGSPVEEFQKTLAHEAGHFTSRPGKADLYQGANPINYAKAISAANPNLSKKDVENLAMTAYRTIPGEMTSKKIEERLHMPESDIKNWDKRFTTSYTPEDYQDIKTGIAIRKQYGLPIE